MPKLTTLTVTAEVFDDGILGVKAPTDLKPGTYDGVLVLQRQAEPPVVQAGETFMPLAEYVEQAKAEYVQRALAACDGNRTQTAKLLGVDARTIFRMLSKE